MAFENILLFQTLHKEMLTEETTKHLKQDQELTDYLKTLSLDQSGKGYISIHIFHLNFHGA